MSHFTLKEGYTRHESDIIVPLLCFQNKKADDFIHAR